MISVCDDGSDKTRDTKRPLFLSTSYSKVGVMVFNATLNNISVIS